MSSVSDFIKGDTLQTLFPLDGPAIVAERADAELRSFVYDRIFSKDDIRPHFMQAVTSEALKDARHTRRVLILDAVSTFYLYDFVLRHSSMFSKPRLSRASKTSVRRRYGYHMQAKKPLGGSEEHQSFRSEVIALKRSYKYFAKVDIANCFNSFYHHDVVHWIQSKLGQAESQQFGAFLREINGGRSVSCFPQGLFPAKALGNLYLEFIESNVDLKSDAIIRFIDDIFLFSNSESEIQNDLFKIQRILSQKNLYLNSSKSLFGTTPNQMNLSRTNAIRKSLLKKRAGAIQDGYDSAASDEVHLTDEEFKYLSDLISSNDVAEEDVELALALVTEDQEHAERLIHVVFESFPHLIKNLSRYLSSSAYDGAPLGAAIRSALARDDAPEFVLFWCVRILRDIFKVSKSVANLLIAAYQHKNSTDVVRAAVLECASNQHGLLELKEDVLRNSGSSTVAMSAAVGLESLDKAKRNMLYKYAANTGQYMYLVTLALQRPSQ